MINLPLAISIADEVTEAPAEADLYEMAHRLHQEHPEAESTTEEIAEVLADAFEECRARSVY